MRVGVVFGDGFDKIKESLEKIADNKTTNLNAELVLCGYRIERFAKKLINSHATVSHSETRYNPKRVVPVSAEGGPPNSDTGILVNSIYTRIEPGASGAAVVKVGSDLKYAKYLEFGTTHMRARPWLFPSFIATYQENVKRLRDAIKKAS